MRQAADRGADVVITPELASVGYSAMYSTWDDSDLAPAYRWMNLSLPVDSPEIQRFGALAKQLGIAVGVSFLQRWDGFAPPRNSIALFDRHGALVYVYSKVHTCNFGVLGPGRGAPINQLDALTTPGNNFVTGVLDTVKGEVVVGSMICYDREHAEPARMLMLNGAEVILQPNACPLGTTFWNMMAARAAENALAVVVNNWAAPMENGHSRAWDHTGAVLMAAPEMDHGLFVARVDVAALRAYRAGRRGALADPPAPRTGGLRPAPGPQPVRRAERFQPRRRGVHLTLAMPPAASHAVCSAY